MKQNYSGKNERLQPDDPGRAEGARDRSSEGCAPLVQVVVIHYGNRQLTLDCLRSLERLTYSNYQIVVIDNNLKEDGQELPATDVSAVAVIRNRGNNGFSAACNQGIRVAWKNKANYVWILNNDTEATPQALTALVTMAEGNPDLGAVGSVLIEQESEIRGGTVSFLSGLPSHITNGKYRIPDYLCGASVLLRMKALNDAGLFDTGFFLYWEDTDLSFRIRKAGWRLEVTEGSLVRHKGSSSAVFQSADYDFNITASSVRFFSRHCRFWFLPVGVSAAGRMTRRAISGKFNNARAVWLGLQEGLGRRTHRNPASIPRLEED